MNADICGKCGMKVIAVTLQDGRQVLCDSMKLVFVAEGRELTGYLVHAETCKYVCQRRANDGRKNR